jgi:hypothetical protein
MTLSQDLGFWELLLAFAALPLVAWALEKPLTWAILRYRKFRDHLSTIWDLPQWAGGAHRQIEILLDETEQLREQLRARGIDVPYTTRDLRIAEWYRERTAYFGIPYDVCVAEWRSYRDAFRSGNEAEIKAAREAMWRREQEAIRRQYKAEERAASERASWYGRSQAEWEAAGNVSADVLAANQSRTSSSTPET